MKSRQVNPRRRYQRREPRNEVQGIEHDVCRSMLDQLGRPTTDQLRVTERFTRTHFGHLRIDVTIDDPGAYTAPWGASQVVHLRSGWEPLEFICGENNKDIENLPGDPEAAGLTNLDAARLKGYLE